MQQEARSLNGLMPRAMESLATAYCLGFEIYTHIWGTTCLRELRSEKPKGDFHTSCLLQCQSEASLAIWKILATQPPKLRLLDQAERKTL